MDKRNLISVKSVELVHLFGKSYTGIFLRPVKKSSQPRKYNLDCDHQALRFKKYLLFH